MAFSAVAIRRPVNALARRFFVPPRLGTDELTHRARTFHQVAWGSVLMAAFFLGALVLLQPETLARRGISTAIVVVLSLILIEVNRRGHTRTASALLIVGLIGIVGHRAYTSGGISAPATAGFVILVLGAGLLLGLPGAIAGAVVCAGLGLTFALLENAHAMPPSALNFTPIATWIYLCMWLGLAIVFQRQASVTLLRALRQAENHLQHTTERVKELRLLHEAARLLQRDRPADQSLFDELVRRLPRAWQHPDDCVARIRYRDIEATTPAWRPTAWSQSIQFATSDATGTIEVAYLSPHPDADDGPFLREERTLLESLSEMLLSYLELRKHQEQLEHLVETRTQQLRESYSELSKLEKLRDNLVHMVVHDMRSPLMVAMGRLQLLRMSSKRALDAESEKHLVAAEQAAQAVTAMTNDLLDVSRLEETRMELKKASVDLMRLAGEVATAFTALEQGRTILAEGGPSIEARCDPALVRRVMENLVSNGIKHTPPGTTVRLQVSGRPGAVRVSVRDQGPGVKPEARQRIFEKFGAVQVRTDKSYHSVGLGLAFCKMAVEAHGGTIDVEPAEGGGSVFWFELPR